MFVRDHLAYVPQPLPDRIDLTDEEMRAASKAFFNAMKTRHTVQGAPVRR